MISISLDLTIPANYNLASHVPVESKVNLPPCKIKGAILQFPAGCQYLAEVTLYASRQGQAKQQILPRPMGGDSLNYIALDDFVHEFPIDVDGIDPFTLYANGWNEDAANQHEIKVIVLIE